METSKVGIREFRADLAEYIASSTPVAVTRHGQTVGYFIPTLAHGDADLAALKTASKALDQILAAKGVDAEMFGYAPRKLQKPLRCKRAGHRAGCEHSGACGAGDTGPAIDP
jgi:antitoxin (DNA-binding transcriptional repressor) of toxin-antitoxin stability system